MIKSIEYKGITFRYNVEGEGVPFILMHGWGCNSSTLASIANAITPGFKVINVDFPGFGSSDEPKTVWGILDYTAALEALVKAEQITEPPILLGHSFGGRVGIVYASRNKVRKLILVDSAGIRPRHSLKYYFKVYSYKVIKHLLPTILGKKGEIILDKYRSKSGSSDYNNATPMMRAILSKVVNEDLKHLMPVIKAPTLLIWGEKDTATPLSDAKIIENLIPDAGLVSFPNCGHYSFLENPIQFKAVLNSFIKEDRNLNS